MNGIILKEAENEEESPSTGEFSLEQVLSSSLNPSKPGSTWLETSSETEVPKPELLELSPEEGKYFVLTDEETDYFVPEVTKTEQVKFIRIAWTDYSFLEGGEAAELALSLEEGKDSLFSSLYRQKVPEGEKDLLKV